MNHIKTLSILTTLLFCMFVFANTSEAAAPIEVGQVAPDISLPNQNKTVLSLSSLRGKMVLVQFWASWDPNSRANNPNLVRLHNKYKEAKFNNAKGFELFTVSLDSETDKWRDGYTRLKYRDGDLATLR